MIEPELTKNNMKTLETINALNLSAMELIGKANDEDRRIDYLLKCRATLDKYGLERDKHELLQDIDKCVTKRDQLIESYKRTLSQILNEIDCKSVHCDQI